MTSLIGDALIMVSSGRLQDENVRSGDLFISSPAYQFMKQLLFARTCESLNGCAVGLAEIIAHLLQKWYLPHPQCIQ